MWIRNIPDDYMSRDSGVSNLNFLYKEDNIYIMDNHLAAGWCWLQELQPEASYNFFHLDRHADLICNAPINSYAFLKDNPHITIDEYTNMNFRNEISIYKVFQWDNYIKQIHFLFPNWFRKCYFATHEYVHDNNPEDTRVMNVTYNPDVFDLYKNINYWLNQNDTNSWIFNLDIDYFFNDDGMQLFSDEYIIALLQDLKNSMDKIAVLTIALSPECCGCWESAIRIMNMISENLEIKFNL